MIGKESIPVLSAACTNCARCIEVCDDDALSFSIRKLVNDKKRRVIMKTMIKISVGLVTAALLLTGCVSEEAKSTSKLSSCKNSY